MLNGHLVHLPDGVTAEAVVRKDHDLHAGLGADVDMIGVSRVGRGHLWEIALRYRVCWYWYFT